MRANTPAVHGVAEFHPPITQLSVTPDHLTQLRVSLSAPDSAPAGSTVPMAIRLENVGIAPLELYFRGRAIAYDIVIRDTAGQTVWRRLQGQIIPSIIQVKVLDPGEVLELPHEWDQRNDRRELVEPGYYMAHGIVLTDRPEPIVSTQKQLLVMEG